MYTLDYVLTTPLHHTPAGNWILTPVKPLMNTPVIQSICTHHGPQKAQNACVSFLFFFLPLLFLLFLFCDKYFHPIFPVAPFRPCKAVSDAAFPSSFLHSFAWHSPSYCVFGSIFFFLVLVIASFCY